MIIKKNIIIFLISFLKFTLLSSTKLAYLPISRSLSPSSYGGYLIQPLNNKPYHDFHTIKIIKQHEYYHLWNKQTIQFQALTINLFFFWRMNASMVQRVWTGWDSSLLDTVAWIDVVVVVGDGMGMLCRSIRSVVMDKGGEVYFVG